MNAALLKALLNQNGDAREIDIRFRIRLPRKTQRRCRSALHRRARSEPPKSQRATTRSNLFSAQQTGEAVKSYDINTEPRECTPDLPTLNIPVDVLKQANGEDEPPVYSDLSAREPDSLANQLTEKESARSTSRRSSTTDIYKVKESEGEQSVMSSRRSAKEERSSRSKEDGSGSARRSSRSVRSSGKESSRSKESSRKSNKESSRSARPTSARNSARSITSKKSERNSARNSESGSARSSGRSNVTERRLSKEPSVVEEPVEESQIPSPPQLSQIHPIDESEDVSVKSSSLPVPADTNTFSSFCFTLGKYEIINRSSDELEKLNLADKLDQQSCPSGREVKEKTESAIEIIEEQMSRIENIQKSVDGTETHSEVQSSLADAYEEFKQNIQVFQHKSERIERDIIDNNSETLEALKSARNAGKRLMKQASQSLFNLLTAEGESDTTSNAHSAPTYGQNTDCDDEMVELDEETVKNTNFNTSFNRAKLLFERLASPDSEGDRSKKNRPQSSKPKTKPRKSIEKEPEPTSNDQSSNEENPTSETRTLKKARLGCDVCYLSKSETDLSLWNYEADMKQEENGGMTEVKIRPKTPKSNIYMELFKEIKELISEVNRLDEAITKESAARQDIENKYKYLLDK